MEIWKDIKGYEGLYQISNLGRVKSLEKKTYAGINKGTYIVRKERILKTNKSRDGYLRVTLCNNKENIMYFVHRLVAQTFLDNPNNYKEVNHKDENKQNNRAENLEWCTRKYNVNYGKRILKTQKKVLQYDKNGKLIKEWNSTMDIQRKLNIANTIISACCLNKKYRKTAGGYVWKYKDTN